MLSPELEAALVRELRGCYRARNRDLFDDKLRPAVLVLGEHATRLGQWQRARRTLEISRRLVLERTWPEVMGVLEHEMAHQFVDEVLDVRDETAHGETFRRVCADRGIDARAAGAAVASALADDERVVARIRKLLALAASPNQHEAEAAMNRAHELMLRHNIDRVDAEQEFEVRFLGEPRQRGNSVEAEIIGLVAQFFFVEVIGIQVYQPRDSTYARMFELCGTRANLDMACHVYEFLLATVERLWREHRATSPATSGRERLAFQTGVVRGFRNKLLVERFKLQRGEGLVWVGSSRLEAFYRRRHPRIVRRRHSIRLGAAHRAGVEAGGNIVLHRPVTSHGERGRLLDGD
jgi:hypothetical protein